MGLIPFTTAFLFIVLTVLTVFIFYQACNKNKIVIIGITFWAVVLATLAVNGFFLKTRSMPPRIMLSLAPAIMLMLYAFATKRGKSFTSALDLESLTWLHSVRIGVELVIYQLCLSKLMPLSMSFEGRNFDILSGLTAPLMAYLVFRKNKLSNRALFAWNALCLILVLQVVITGIFSVPSPIQKWSFNQPNTAVLYFPLIWLPGIVVPLVIYSHIAALVKLRPGRKN